MALMFSVAVLGVLGTNPAAQAEDYNTPPYKFDCGEWDDYIQSESQAIRSDRVPVPSGSAIGPSGRASYIQIHRGLKDFQQIKKGPVVVAQRLHF